MLNNNLEMFKSIGTKYCTEMIWKLFISSIYLFGISVPCVKYSVNGEGIKISSQQNAR
jgi:hypothetical protein